MKITLESGTVLEGEALNLARFFNELDADKESKSTSVAIKKIDNKKHCAICGATGFESRYKYCSLDCRKAARKIQCRNYSRRLAKKKKKERIAVEDVPF